MVVIAIHLTLLTAAATLLFVIGEVVLVLILCGSSWGGHLSSLGAEYRLSGGILRGHSASC